jgi:hypothetical protein
MSDREGALAALSEDAAPAEGPPLPGVRIWEAGGGWAINKE